MRGRRGYAGLAVLVSAAGLLLGTTRPWLSGRTSDPVLGPAPVAATGAQAAPAAAALAAVCLVALVATLTTGPRVRAVAVVALVGSACGAAYAVGRVLVDPAAALAARAAEQAGRTGDIDVDATVTAWTWMALGCAVALLAAAAWLGLSTRGSGGLSRRFDRPAGTATQGRAPARSSWDALSEGDDPTEGPAK